MANGPARIRKWSDGLNIGSRVCQQAPHIADQGGWACQRLAATIAYESSFPRPSGYPRSPGCHHRGTQCACGARTDCRALARAACRADRVVYRARLLQRHVYRLNRESSCDADWRSALNPMGHACECPWLESAFDESGLAGACSSRRDGSWLRLHQPRRRGDPDTAYTSASTRTFFLDKTNRGSTRCWSCRFVTFTASCLLQLADQQPSPNNPLLGGCAPKPAKPPSARRPVL